jgi:hypothetical protein
MRLKSVNTKNKNDYVTDNFLSPSSVRHWQELK